MKTPWFGKEFHAKLRARTKEACAIILVWPLVTAYTLLTMPIRLFGGPPTNP